MFDDLVLWFINVVVYSLRLWIFWLKFCCDKSLWFVVVMVLFLVIGLCVIVLFCGVLDCMSIGVLIWNEVFRGWMGCMWLIGVVYVVVGIFCCSGVDGDCCVLGGLSGNEGVFKGGDVCDDGEGLCRVGK